MKSRAKSPFLNPDGLKRLRKDLAREKAERSLPAFIEQAWEVMEPGTRYIDNWHIALIGEYMQAVNLGQVRRLIINIPPRHMKSIEVTVCYPAWTWIRDPKKRFIKISYSDSLSRKHNILSRDVINSPWYQEQWGEVFSLKDDVNRQNEFKNNHQGFMFSTSVGGMLTGEGGDVIIIDDPQDPQMANSEAERAACVNFFKNKLQTRLNDPNKGAIIVIMQRLHEGDLTGHILTENLGYEHLCLPAIAPQHTVITFPISKKEMIREEGSILNGERFNLSVLDELKRSMGSLQFAGQFQQAPAPADGNLFKHQFFRSYREHGSGEEHTFELLTPEGSKLCPADMCRVFQTCDVAASTKTSADYFVLGTFSLTPENELLILDILRTRVEGPDQPAIMKQYYDRYKPVLMGVESKNMGITLFQSLVRMGLPVAELKPETDKFTRAIPAAARYSTGSVYHPISAHWLDDFISELCKFPNATH
ncbi:MAG: phage terminase large subunit, partial [Synergistaceae bacterium]|nr:phage terminase large subunit [Synergistaceae bacterium]